MVDTDTMALTNQEKMAARATRQKALAALLADDLLMGRVYVGEWNAPEEIVIQAGYSEKEVKRLQNQRARDLCAEYPHLLQVIKPKKPLRVKVLEPVSSALPVFDSVICDWLTISHPLRLPHPPINDGQILKINRNGTREWITECWQTLNCPSSDTSLRIKCDGDKFLMTGNIGRFGETDNLLGLTVTECIAKWRKILTENYPFFNVFEFFGADFEKVDPDTGLIETFGTRITRCDLAGNFYTDNYAALCAQLMTHKINRLAPRVGKYGPTWGYESQRGNWFRGKLYDKLCELSGRRTPASGETTARFEVQLGSELLKRQGLNVANGWKDKDMDNVIFAEFSNQVFKDQAKASTWTDLPPHLRTYAVMWREGIPLRNQCKSNTTFYRVLAQLREYGIDASQPCNIVTLTQRIEVIKVMPLPARRVA
jgi:hypothetical protein